MCVRILKEPLEQGTSTTNNVPPPGQLSSVDDRPLHSLSPLPPPPPYSSHSASHINSQLSSPISSWASRLYLSSVEAANPQLNSSSVPGRGSSSTQSRQSDRASNRSTSSSATVSTATMSNDTQYIPVTGQAPAPTEPEYPTTTSSDDIPGPLSLIIDSSLEVNGSNNHIGSAAMPSISSTVMARTIAANLRELSMTRGGVPMIDEEGRPRQISFSIKGTITLNGDGNVISGFAVKKRGSMSGEDDDEAFEEEMQGRVNKRRASGEGINGVGGIKLQVK